MKRRNKIKKKRMVLTNPQVYRITHQIYSFLEKGETKIIWKNLHNECFYGYCDEESDDIVIDPRKELLSTVVHEILHKIHDYWTETKVRQWERKIMNALTPKQVTHLIKVIAKSL